MFFSLTNSLATFQTMMNDIFKDLIDEGYVAVYMDDILVYTRMIEHHREVIARVLIPERAPKTSALPQGGEMHV